MDISKSLKDKLAGKTLFIISAFSGFLLILIAGVMLYKSEYFLTSESLIDTILGTVWNFEKEVYGLRPYIIGSLLVTGIALIIGGIPSVFCAIYLSEYASNRLRRILKPFVDLLASIPSVVFGLWGMMILVPFVRRQVAPIFGASTSGQCLLSGGVVLGIMITPIIISISDEVLQSVPQKYKKASLALGSTHWQAIKTNIKKVALPGIIGGIILGFGRAIGETIAMSMISGSAAGAPSSIWNTFSTLTTLINNKLGYVAAEPKSVSALALAGFILLVIVLVTNILGRLVVNKTTSRMKK